MTDQIALPYGMQVPMGRFLLVEIEPGVHQNRVNAFMHMWTELAGVRSITDLSLVDQEFMQTILRRAC